MSPLRPNLITATITCAYDPLYCLTSAAYSATQAYTYTYTYDAVGSRTAMTKTITSTVAFTHVYEYDTANRLTKVDDQAYTWDANGNLLSDGTRTFTYDVANRLVQVVSGTITTTFAYNGDGHRMRKVADGVTTTYVVAVLGLPQVVVETTGGSSTAYLYGHDLLGEEGTAWAWHLNDGLGSVRQLTDEDGQVDDVAAYSPFGVSDDGDADVPHGYTGERWYGGVGLLYLRARWYAPGVGRFTTRDTWPGDSFRSMSHNDWLYVYANPINLTDPSGHDPNCRKGAKRCARERILEIIEEEDPNRAEALFRLFEDDELFDLWGKAAGRTSDKRLTWVLKSAESVPFLPIDFGIEEFAGDCGFAEEFRDSQLYPIWELDPSESNQVGHFLSAVDITYGAWPTGLMIGHEQVSDRKRLRNLLSFLIYVKEEDYDHWDAAVEYDEGGFLTQRDEELWAILRFKPTTPFGGVEAERRGNSLQDLRLSLKGYRFALWVRENKSLHPIRAGRWLRNNLGIKTLINAPR